MTGSASDLRAMDEDEAPGEEQREPCWVYITNMWWIFDGRFS